ncbi:Cyclic nucleotide-binding domain-containing protein 2 [Anthophora plagiata]
MHSYGRKVSLRESFIEILSRKSLIPKRATRLKGNYLFRAIVRLILEYIEWLTEVPVVEEISDDVAVNIRMAQQKKVEKLELTLQDRSVLLTKTEERSSEDRKYIYELFNKFQVFRKYPDRLREILAGVCFYQYLRPGRVIVRQDRVAENLYFILNGEVSLSKIVTDRWTGESQEIDMGVLTAGDIFGQIALLHTVPRSATVVSKTTVDLILISRQDFHDILRPTLKKEWDVLQDALVHFNYFKSWDEDTIRECCILSRLKDYQPDEVLLGDAKGMVNYVHFLLEGECRLIEHMIVREQHSTHGVNYELYDPEKVGERMESVRFSRTLELSKKMDELEYEYETSKINVLAEENNHDFVDYTQIITSSKPTDRKMDFERSSIITTALLDVVNEWHKITDVAEMLMREPSSTSQQRYPSDVRTIFMQICTFTRGACFGLGEDMVNRRIVAVTPVRCFLVPRYFLSVHNRANIWERVKLFMDSKFPTKEQLFKEFVNNRRWLVYKKGLLHDIGKRGRRIQSNATMHDIPYAIRIVNDVGMDI